MTAKQSTCPYIGLRLGDMIKDPASCIALAMECEHAWHRLYRHYYTKTCNQDLQTAMKNYLTEQLTISEIVEVSYAWMQKHHYTHKQYQEQFKQLFDLFHPYKGKIPEEESDRVFLADSLANLAVRLMGIWLDSSEDDRNMSKQTMAEHDRVMAELASTKSALAQALAELAKTQATLAKAVQVGGKMSQV